MTGQTTRELLIEIGTEELPPKALESLASAFERGVCEGLRKAGLAFADSRRYATPRRLAVHLSDVATRQPERRQERRGPALSAAFDPSGKPSKAAQGFARSCGVGVESLQTLRTEKGAWLVHTSVSPGRSASELIPSVVRNALAQLPVAKRMRWADRDDEFIRPVHWAVLLLGEQPIPASILGVTAGRKSYGHRFHHPEGICLNTPERYVNSLKTVGKVIVDFEERRTEVRRQAEQLAAEAGGRAVIDPSLLDEVTALVEWPVALLGGFEPRFLTIPAEVLMTTMQHNQKYFPVVDEQNRLLPCFIAVANLESKNPEQVRAGNERVIRPRFADAEFFWQQDLKRPLESHREALRSMVFQHRLGSLYDKSERVAALARFIAAQTDSDPALAERAARLAKCDLLTDMVQEFPELQGTMGRYYAHHEGQPEVLAHALEEQYLPRFAGDVLPATELGRIIGLADRLDTLLGIFAIGQLPSGNRDPFALRRAALGTLRLLIESAWDLDVLHLLQQAAERLPESVEGQSAVPAVYDFMMERLRAYYLEQDVQSDAFEAVLVCRPTRPLDFDRRVRAVSAFRKLPQAESLSAANKRIQNILKKAACPTEAVHRELLVESAEQNLAEQLADIARQTQPLLADARYSEALSRMAALKEPIDGFFDEVMVMVEDAVIRANRLALLEEVRRLFLRVADVSQLQN